MRILKTFLILLTLGLMVQCSDDDPQPIIPPVPQAPTITAISPDQVSRGQSNLTVILTGTNMTGASSVTMGPGVVVQSVNATSATRTEVVISVNKSANPGTRPVTLVATSGSVTQEALFRVINNVVPTPSFVLDPPADNLSTKINITFDASSSDDPNNGQQLKYRWDFGDGSTETGRRTTHQFREQGTFEVTLTVEDGLGGTSSTTKEFEVGRNASPIPSFTFTPASGGDEQDEWVFDASGSYDPDGRIKEYVWFFNDGKRKETGIIVRKTFKHGKYDVKLTVTDNGGSGDFTTRQINVEESKIQECTGKGARNRGILFAHTISVSGRTVKIKWDKPGATCANSYYKCGDFRNGEAEGIKEFFGILNRMYDNGDGTFDIEVKCPINWPPTTDLRVFLYFKTCHDNFCP